MRILAPHFKSRSRCLLPIAIILLARVTIVASDRVQFKTSRTFSRPPTSCRWYFNFTLQLRPAPGIAHFTIEPQTSLMVIFKRLKASDADLPFLKLGPMGGRSVFCRHSCLTSILRLGYRVEFQGWQFDLCLTDIAAAQIVDHCLLNS
jgi:hypothetical protein